MRSPVLAALFILGVRPVNSQAINPDLIVFSTMSQWPNLRSCVQYSFAGDIYVGGLDAQIGCTTNACLCRADILALAEQTLSSDVRAACSDLQDISTATSILASYCSAKGYTSIIESTILPTSGMCTYAPSTCTPTATVTAYVTQYVTVSSAACKSSQQQVVKVAVGVISVLLLHGITRL
jgi:hypothetical protein